MPSNPCPGCLFGKFSRVRFGKRFPENLATKPLERVYSDVCGPFPVTALTSNAKYVCLFIDEFPRYVFVYLIERKSHVFKALKQFVRESRRLTGCPVNELICLQTDNGGV